MTPLYVLPLALFLVSTGAHPEDMIDTVLAEVRDLKEHNIHIESELRELKNTSQNMENANHNMEKDFADLKNTNQNIENDYLDMTHMNQNLEKHVADLKNTNQNLANDFADMRNANRILEKDVADVTDKCNLLEATLGSTSVVAFFVRIGRFSLPGTPVPFDDILLNQGGGFDVNVGQFVAPVTGYYDISYSILAHANCGTTYTCAALLINGATQGEACSEVYASGSQALTLQLAAGDAVWIELNSCADMYNGGRMNTFSGHLVYKII